VLEGHLLLAATASPPSGDDGVGTTGSAQSRAKARSRVCRVAESTRSLQQRRALTVMNPAQTRRLDMPVRALAANRSPAVFYMLVMLGGRERTEVEWRDLLAARAFEITETTSPGPANLIDARPI
jgi:hypothetical protein